MDLDSRLANLSLGEIASLLTPKQQEVLLASISVAATLIQQIQQEDQQILQEEQHLQQQEEDHHHLVQHQQQQHHHLQQHQLEDEELDDEDEEDEELEQSDYQHLQQQYNKPQPRHHQTHQRPNQRNHNNNTHNTTNNTTTNTNDTTLDEADERDLLIIRNFAEELKARRKSIRLSQKGAAQSLRAFTGGVQPCTDAIIYHFENLQLEPDRAMQLIPLLKNWLEWAEDHRYSGKQLPMMNAVTKVPRERKRKVVLFNEKAKQYLEDAFVKNNHPDRYQLDVISNDLNIPTRSIRKWFTNRRQRKRFAEKFSPVDGVIC